MAYADLKKNYKDGEILHGIDLNANNAVAEVAINDNFDRIQGLEIAKQDVINNSNKLDYSLLDNTPEIPTKVSDLDNDTGFITASYHDNTKQDVLTAGEGISIEGNVISNTQTSAEWGNIQGSIEDQTDLMNEFGNKQDTLESGVNIKTINNQSILGRGNLSIGGGSGGTNDYDQLDHRPQINGITLTGNKSLSDLGINNPSKVSDLQNDAGYITASYHDNTKQDVIDSNNKLPYSNISGTPTIPTKISDLTNDNNTVTDSNYVHTDNNFTTAEKTKLSGIESGAQVNVDEIVIGDEEPTEDTKIIIDTDAFEPQYSDITDEYSEASNMAYSCDYVNEKVGVELFNGVSKFGTDTVLVPEGYKYCDVYIQTNYTSNNQGGTILRVDTSTTPSVNQTKGCIIPLGDTIFVECEITYKTDRTIRAGWVGTYPNFASSTVTTHLNDSNYYVYKIVGYK